MPNAKGVNDTAWVSIVAQNNGSSVPLQATADGALKANLAGSNLTGFGEIQVSDNTPLFQQDFTYNYINPETSLTVANGGATVTAADGMLTVTSGAQANSLGVWRPRRTHRYRPGQSSLERFTLLLGPATAGNSQLGGFSSGESGFLIGSIDTVRGCFRTHNGIREIQTATVTVASSDAQDATVTLGDAVFTVPVTNSASLTTTAAELAAFDYSGIYPGWSVSQMGATVRFVCNVAGNVTGTFSIAFPTSGTATIAETVAGVAATIESIPQASFNVDKLDGTGPSSMVIDWTKLNVFYLKWTYLGAGPIEFGVCNPLNDGEFIPFHRIVPANTTLVPSLSQAGGFFSLSNRNTTNETAVACKSASVAGFVQGPIRRLGVQRGTTATKTGVSTTFVPIVSLRSDHLFQNRISMAEIFLLAASVSNNSGNRSIEVVLVEDAVLTAPNWAAVAASSIANLDTAATAYTGGIIKRGFVVGPLGRTAEVTADALTTLGPNRTITIAARILSGAGTADVSVGLTWAEDQ